jgi:O-antigen/teichoic acid export membrane protein
MKSRKQTISLAYAATGGAKIFGALVQLAVLPIAAKALGFEAFGLLFTVAALASFPLIAMAGFSPAASALIAKAKASSEDDRVGGYFWSLWFWSVISGVLLAVISYLAVRSFALPSANDGHLALVFALFIVSNFAAAPIEGTRAAFGETHYNSGFALLGSAVTLIAILIAPNGADTAYYFAAIYLVPVVVQVLNLSLFVVQRRSRIGMPRVDGTVRKEIMGLLAANVQAQGGMVLYLHGGVYIMAITFGTAAVAVIGAFVRIAVLIHSLLLALFAPVLPTLTESVVQADRNWLNKAIRHLTLIAATILLAQATVTAFAGDRIAREFFHITGDQSSGMFLAIALFVFCYCATHLLFLTRLAVSHQDRRGSKILVAAIIGLGVAITLAQNSAPLFLGVQAIAMATIAMAVYGRDLWRVSKLELSGARG